MNYIKKVLAVFLSVVMLIGCFGTGFTAFAATIVAQGQCGDAAYWKLDSDNVFTVYGSGSMWARERWTGDNFNAWNVTSIVISNGITTIGNGSFGSSHQYISGDPEVAENSYGGTYNNGIGVSRKVFKNATSLTLASTLTKIEDSAFADCTRLSGSLIIPASVSTIGKYAFEGCSGFTGNLKLSNSLAKIDVSAFRKCTGFTGNLVIPDMVTEICDAAFDGCSGFNGTLSLGNFVVTIGSMAFADCNSLTGSIVIPDYVESIGDLAFYQCSSFNGDITIGNRVKTIGYSAFQSCSNAIGSITIGSSVEKIGDYAFCQCGFTGDLIIPDSVTTIGNSAFSALDKLDGSIVIGNSVKTIGNYAFANCYNLKGTLNIPDSVTSVGTDVFHNAARGYTFHMEEHNEKLRENDTFTFYKKYCGFNPNEKYHFVDIVEGERIEPTTSQNGKQVYYIYCADPSHNSAHTNNELLTVINEPLVYGQQNSPFVEIVPSSLILGIGDSRQLTVNKYPSDAAIVFESTDSSIVSVTADGTITANSVGSATVTAYMEDEPLVKTTVSITVVDSSLLPVAQGQCGDNAYWKIDENGVFYVYGTGDMWKRTMWTGDAFDAWNITGIIIQDGITSIGYNAFGASSTYYEGTLPESNSFGGYFVRGNNNNHKYIKAFKNATSNIILPETIVSIGDYAFIDCSGLTGSLTIPNSVITIGYSAFDNCSGLDGSLTIGTQVETIGNYAFARCKKLVGNLIIPDSVTSLGIGAFDSCSGFNGNLVIGNNVPKIQYRTFDGCKSLKGSLVIPDSVTLIDSYAFCDCSGFDGILKIGENVQKIGESTFYNCTGLKGDLTIPNQVNTIGSYAFYSCTGLDGNINIGTSVETIKSNAFEYCSNLVGNLIIPNSVLSIENSAFRSCTNLNGFLNIGNSVSTIGDKAFSECFNLTGTLVVPDSVTSMGTDVFHGTAAYTNRSSVYNGNLEDCNAYKFYEHYRGDNASDKYQFIKIVEQPTVYPTTTQNGTQTYNLYCTDATHNGEQSLSALIATVNKPIEYEPVVSLTATPNPILVDMGNTEQILINITPDNAQNAPLVYSSADETIATVSSTGLVTPVSAGETTITVTANDGSNVSVVIPVTVNEASVVAQGQCGNTAYWKVTSDNKFVVYGTGDMWTRENWTGDNFDAWTITEVEIKEGITSIGEYAFSEGKNGYSSSSQKPEQSSCGGFYRNGSFYRAKTFKNARGNIVIPNTVTTIERNAFTGTYFNGTLTLGNSVATIGEKAFQNCSSLVGDLIIPDSVTTIGNYAFGSCSKLNGVLSLGNSVTTIGESAFSLCRTLTGQLIIPDSVVTIGSSAFYMCSSFSGELIIGNSVETIGNNAFQYCSGFTGNLTIPNSVKTIGNNTSSVTYANGTFNGCTKITSLTLGNSIETIGNGCFWNCTNLSGELTIPGSVTYIGKKAFMNCYNLSGTLDIPDSVTTVGEEAFHFAAKYTNGSTSAVFNGKLEDCAPYKFFANYRGDNSSDKYQFIEVVETNRIEPTASQNGLQTYNIYCFDSTHGGNHIDSGTTANLIATVNEPLEFALVESIVINTNEIELGIGESENLSVTINPDNASNKELSFTSSNPSIATVSEEGLVTGVAKGTTTITVAATDGSGVSATAIVTVTGALVNNVTADPKTMELDVNETRQINVTIDPDDAANKNVTYSSSNTTVATVDENGIVTAVSPGVAAIIVTAADGSNKSDVVDVTVNKIGIAKPASDNTIFVYDGTEKTYVIPANDHYTVTNNKRTDAGTQNVTVSLNDKTKCQWNDGTTADLTFEFTIARAAIAGVDIQNYTGNYDGQPHTVTVTAPDGATITYSNTENGEYASTPIAVAGNKNGTTTNTIWVKVENGDNYEPFVGSGTITINHVDVTGISVEQDSITMKIGDEKMLSPSVEPSNASNPDLNYVSSDTAVVTVDENGKITAIGEGTAVVTITSDDDPSVSKPVSVTVTKIDVNVPAADTTVFVYDGTEKTYNIPENVLYTVSGNKQTNAGTYTVEVKLVDVNNYQWNDGNDGDTRTYTFVINRADAEMTLPTGKTVDYNGIEQVLANAGSSEDGIVQYKITSINSIPQDNEWTDTVPEAKNAGSYVIAYQIIPDANHNAVAGGTFESVINKVNPVIDVVPAGKTLDYEKNTQELTTAGSTGDGTVMYRISKVNHEPQNNNWQETLPVAQNAATYNLEYYIKGDENHDDSPVVEITSIINKVDAVVDIVPEGKELDYEEVMQTLAEAGETEDGTIMYKITEINGVPQDNDWSDTLPEAEEIGVYEIAYYVEGDDNHDDSPVQTFTATIKKLPAAIETSPTAKDLTYTGENQELVNAGTATEGEVQYKITKINGEDVNNEWSTVIPTGNDAGIYEVSYRVTPEDVNPNPEIGTTTVTIKKAKIEKPAADNTEFIYDGTEKVYVLTANPHYTVSNNTRTLAGSQNVTVTLNDTTNYQWADGSSNVLSYVFTVAKAQIEGIAIQDYTGNYDGEMHTISVIAPDGAVITYSATEDGTYTSEPIMVSGNKDEATTTTIWFKVENGDNYEPYIASGTVSIGHVAPTGITIDQDAVTMKIGDTKTLEPVVEPANTSNPALTYASSDETVATVDENGKITAVGNGTAVITIISQEDPSVKTEVNVTVYTPTTGINVDDTPVVIKVGETKEIPASAEPDNASVLTLTYTTDDDDVISVEGNQITGVAPGTETLIIKTADGIEKEIKVIVADAAASYDKTELNEGETATLTVEAIPSDELTVKNISAVSSDSAVATVDPNGNVTAVKAGTIVVTLSITLEDENGTEVVIEKTAEITVNHVPAEPVQEPTHDNSGDGTYKFDLVTYCENDNEEIDRDTVTLEKHDAVEPTVNTPGNVEHYKDINSDDTYIWDPEKGDEGEYVKKDDVTIPAIVPEHVDRVEPTDDADGNIEYYHVGDDKYVKDDDGKFIPVDDVTLHNRERYEQQNIHHDEAGEPDRFDLVTLCTHDDYEFGRTTVTLEKYDAVEPTVNTPGNVEHYKDINSDDTYIWDPEKGDEGEYVKKDDVTISAIVPEHVDRVEPTDDADGNIEYYHVGDDKYVKDDDGKFVPVDDVTLHNRERYEQQNIHHDDAGEPDRFDLVTLCTHDDYEFGRTTVTLEKHDAVEPDVNNDGNVEYYEGSNGKNYVWNDDTDKYDETDNVTIPAIVPEHVDRVEPTDDADGNIEYYHVGDDKYVKDDDGKFVPVDDVTLHNRERYEQQNIHHDEAGEPDRFDLVTLCTHDNYEFGRTTVTLEKHDAVEPDVNNDGNVEYYEGSDGKNYVWNDDTDKYDETDNVTVPKVAVEPVSGRPATETEHGQKDHFKDDDGNLYVLDGNKYVPVTEADLVIHNITKIKKDEVAVGCVVDGGYDVYKHCSCNDCDKADVFVKHVTIPAVGYHQFDNGVVVKAATCTVDGTLKKTCTVCGETVDVPIPAGHKDADRNGYCDVCGEEVGWHCSKCDWYNENKDKPGAFGIVVKIIHIIVHMVESINHLT